MLAKRTIPPKRNLLRNKPWLYAFILVVLSILVYSNTFNAGFVYDDYFYIVNNPLLKPPYQVLKILTTEYAQGYNQSAVYRPVASLSYMLNHAVNGMNPHGFHVVNVVIHAITTMMVFLVLCKIVTKTFPAFLGALCFGINPIRTEAVSWIVGRTELLAALCTFLALYMYLLRARKYQWIPRIISLVFFMIALFSKENAVMFPVILLLYDLIIKKNNLQKIFEQFKFSYLPYFIVIFAWILVRWEVMGYVVPSGNVRSLASLGMGDRIITIVRVLGYYIFLQFFPFNLCADHDFKILHSFLSPSFIISVILIVVILYFMLSCLKKKPVVFFLLAWFFVAVFPVSNIIPIGEVMAERFLYLPSFGIHALLGLTFGRLVLNSKKHVSRLLVCILVTVFFLGCLKITYFRNYTWSNSTNFWKDLVLKSPGKTRTHVGMGTTYLEQNKQDLAEIHLKTAIQLNNNTMGVARAWFNLGKLYQQKKDLPLAKRYYEESLKIAPNLFKTHNNLGNVLLEMGKYWEALKHFMKAVQLEPKNSDIYNNSGNVYQKIGDYTSAVNCYEKALTLDPHNKTIKLNMVYALNNHASQLLVQNKIDDSIAMYRKSINLYPKFPGTYLNLAIVFTRKNEPLNAIKILNRLLEIEPRNTRALQFLFELYALKLKNLEKAKIILHQLENTSINQDILQKYKKFLGSSQENTK